MRIRFASAPCGSGKTYNLIDWACALAHAGQRVIVLQPTHELIDKTVEEELDARTTLPLYRVFHGGTVREGTVAKALIRFLKDPPDGGHIVFNTHALLPVVPFWPNKAGYELMVDEELPAFRYRAHRIPHNHSFITGSIDIEPVNAMYGRVNVVDEELAEIGRNKDGDDLFEVIAETVRIITNPHWDTFVNLEQYEKLRSGKIKRLAFHSILGPSVVEGFGSVFMTSANFRDTPICRLWSEKGVEFQEAKQFSEALRFTQHPNGNLLTIHYASDHAWSRKRLQATAGPDGRIAFDLMVEAAKRLFEGSSFVWQANKSQAANPFGENAFRLPNKPHGLNSFLHVNDIAFLSALNPTTDHFRFLETQGLTGSEVRRAVYHSAAYQSVMRTSLRDPESLAPKRILVPDRALAEYLHELFPGSRLEKLDIGLSDEPLPRPGRPRKHFSGRERAAACRRRAHEKKVAVLNDLMGLVAQDADGERSCLPDKPGEGEWRNENSDIIISDFVTQLTEGTVYPAKKASRPLGYLRHVSEEKFFTYLKCLHSRQLRDKDKNILISPAVFDPDRIPGSRRAKENILFLRHVWLDFENGDLKPSEFPELFPHVRMVVTNTYRHTPEKPRFRVIISTTQSMSLEAYDLIYHGIASKLEEAGYSVEGWKRTSRYAPSRKSGLDWGKRAPTSIFNAPCQAENPSESFFDIHAELGRMTLDPAVWVENSAHLIKPEAVSEPKQAQSREIDQEAIRVATEKWRTSSTFPGEGGMRFFNFALDLRSAGMSLPDIESVLRGEVPYGRSPRERKAQIPSIMKSLRASSGRR